MTRAEKLRFIEKLEATCVKTIDKDGSVVYSMNGYNLAVVDYNNKKKEP